MTHPAAQKEPAPGCKQAVRAASHHLRWTQQPKARSKPKSSQQQGAVLFSAVLFGAQQARLNHSCPALTCSMCVRMALAKARAALPRHSVTASPMKMRSTGRPAASGPCEQGTGAEGERSHCGPPDPSRQWSTPLERAGATGCRRCRRCSRQAPHSSTAQQAQRNMHSIASTAQHTRTSQRTRCAKRLSSSSLEKGCRSSHSAVRAAAAAPSCSLASRSAGLAACSRPCMMANRTSSASVNRAGSCPCPACSSCCGCGSSGGACCGWPRLAACWRCFAAAAALLLLPLLPLSPARKRASSATTISRSCLTCSGFSAATRRADKKSRPRRCCLPLGGCACSCWSCEGAAAAAGWGSRLAAWSAARRGECQGARV